MSYLVFWGRSLPQPAGGVFFEGSSPLSHIPVLRGISPSMDVKRSAASHDREEYAVGRLRVE
jgi:hypothetical protein